MAEDEFFGRIINPGFNSQYFELCDVCEKRVPNWIESRQNQGVSEIRLTCDECHTDYITKLEQIPIADTETEFEIYDEVPTEVEDITPVDRPAWMQEFIDEGVKEGIIETVSGSEEAEAHIESYQELDVESEDIVEDENLSEISIDEPSIQIATWSAGFVKEALFGLNPEEWLDQQNAFSAETVDLTIFTLSQMSINQVTNVKISAIHCLNTIKNRYPDKKDEIISSISNFTDDLDEMVSNYAQQTIDLLK